METLKIKEPVKLRFKSLKNGNVSLYLDIYYAGRRKYDFLQLYLIPERTNEDRLKNKKTLAIANAIKSQRIVEFQNRSHGFMDNSTMGKTRFIDYLRDEAERYFKKGGKMYSQSIKNSINHLIVYAGDRITFKQVDKSYLLGYIHFLDRIKGRGGKPLSGASKSLYFQVVVTALNRAVKTGIIERNPAHLITMEDRPEVKKKPREFLTLEEVKKLIATPCKYENVKRAFLFCCFCGLRLSDVKALTWKDIERLDELTYQVRAVQQKTGIPVWVPLSSNAIEQLPESNNKSGLIFDLPMVWVIEKYLAEWGVAAGIKKHITFHTARHTCATMLLTYGADIYTVSKILGHTNIQTTQIYAKIIDEKKREAVNLVPNL